MENYTIAAIGAVLIGLMALALYLFYSRTRRKPPAQRDDVTLHVKLGAKPEMQNEKILNLTIRKDEFFKNWKKAEVYNYELQQQLFEAQSEATRLAGKLSELELKHSLLVSSCNMIEKQRDEYLETLRQINDKDSPKISVVKELTKERDEAIALANDLREYLDRALATIKDLEQINAELMDKRGINGKAALRDAKGRFVRVPSRDWTKPQAFPKWYLIPKGTRVVCVSEDRDKSDKYYIAPGTKGITTECYDIPFCDWDNGKKQVCMGSQELYPENPLDHPEHPEFRKK